MEAQDIDHLSVHEDMLRDSVRTFLTGQDRVSPLQRNREYREQQPGFDRAMWREMAEAGWIGLMFEEAHGGLGLGLAEAVIVAEELGKGVVPEPYGPAAILAAGVVHDARQSDVAAELLPAIAQGSVIPALAWQEEPAGLDPSQVRTVATQQGGAISISGTKRFVPYAAEADLFLVTASGAEGLMVCRVRPDADGVSMHHAPLVDGSFATTLSLQEVQVGASDVIAIGEVAVAALEQALAAARVVASAEMLGMMGAVFEMTLQYLRDRVQFDKPIGSFQALQHRSVDLFVQQELSRSRLMKTVRLLEYETDSRARAAAVSATKARVTEALLKTTKESIQMHGAIGYTDEYDLALFARRALVRGAWLGNAAWHRRQFSELAPAYAE